MKVQRFRARSYAEALRQVKDALGEDAVILESRQIRQDTVESAGNDQAGSKWRWRWPGTSPGGAAGGASRALAEVELTAAIGDGADALVTPADPPPASAPARERAAPPPPPPRARPIRLLEARLLSEEVEQGLAEELALAVEDGLPADEAEDEELVLDAAVGELLARVGIYPPDTPVRGPRVQVVVGPAGVGKTTTIAKLAAAGSLRRDEQIALIGAGTGPRSPVLERVAEVLGASWHASEDMDGLMEILAPLGDADRILIDTPPISPYDAERIDELVRHLSVLPQREVHLILSPTWRDRDLRAAVDGFSPLGPTALIFTHLDEAACYGALLNACTGSGLPLSWLAFGPRIPSDIEAASAERVIDLLLDLSGRRGDAS